MARQKKQKKTEGVEDVGLPLLVEILGKNRPVAPPSFGVRESLCHAAGGAWEVHETNPMNLYRVSAAVLCACCPGFGPDGLTWPGAGYDVLVYGEASYSWLRQSGLERGDMLSIAQDLISGMSRAMFPRPAEVEEEVAFSEAVEDGQTSTATD